MKLYDQRQEEAEVRKKERTKRTNVQQISKLDDKLGKGIGAVKERKRLSK